MEEKMNQAGALAKSVKTENATTTCQCEIMMVNFENEILLKEKIDLALLLSETTSTKQAFSADMIHDTLKKELNLVPAAVTKEILNFEDTLQRCGVDISNMTMNYNIEEQKLTHCTRRAERSKEQE